MAVTSHRDYLTWMLYLDEQWNTKTKEDYYLSQIAVEIGNVLRTKNFLSLEDKFIRFESSVTKPAKEESEEERQDRLSDITSMAKSAMAARFGWTKEQRKKAEDMGRQ